MPQPGRTRLRANPTARWTCRGWWTFLIGLKTEAKGDVFAGGRNYGASAQVVAKLK